MQNENRIMLARYRLKKAQQCANTARNILFDGDYETSIDCSCRAYFHGMRAVMALDGLAPKEDLSLSERFIDRYIRTGIFEERFSTTLKEAFELNSACVYEDFFMATKQAAEQQMEGASAFLKAAEHYIEK